MTATATLILLIGLQSQSMPMDSQKACVFAMRNFYDEHGFVLYSDPKDKMDAECVMSNGNIIKEDMLKRLWINGVPEEGKSPPKLSSDRCPPGKSGVTITTMPPSGGCE